MSDPSLAETRPRANDIDTNVKTLEIARGRKRASSLHLLDVFPHGHASALPLSPLSIPAGIGEGGQGVLLQSDRETKREVESDRCGGSLEAADMDATGDAKCRGREWILRQGIDDAVARESE